ncbi:MAG: hypothetical protein OJF60_000410 [Burkholderiaceae bacterium]|nr:MAG: hypothetical protein OJF60_000410 [Burkholderiaceae bacterium]
MAALRAAAIDPMNQLPALGSLGFTLPSPTYLFGAILFGLVGLGAWRWGKKTERPVAKWLGVALMLYPYAVPWTWALYLIGLGLCAALYWFRD